MVTYKDHNKTLLSLLQRAVQMSKKKKMVTYKDHNKTLLSLLQRAFQMSKKEKKW